MNISLKALRDGLSPDTQELIEAKLSALEKHLGIDAETAVLDCEVEESIATVRAGARVKAAGTLTAGGRTYHAEAISDTLEGSVDKVRDELVSELQKARGKERSYIKRGGRALKRLLRFWY